MPVCCRCNASGQCKNCSCKKSKKRCLNCLPSRRGHCANAPSDTSSLETQRPQAQSLRRDGLPEVPNGGSNPPEVNEEPTAAANFTPANFTPANFAPTLEEPEFTPTFTSAENTPALWGEDLPAYLPPAAANFKWGVLDAESFAQSVNAIYDEVVHWKRNLFKIPSGKAGRMFFQELTRLFTAYAENSALQSTALKAAMIMQTLLLQKPHQRSKTKDHSTHLECRLKLWAQGSLDELLSESRTIQQKAMRAQKGVHPPQVLARSFAKLMMQGKVKAALRLIDSESNGGPLQLES